MAYSSVPSESKSQINKAGKVLINRSSKPKEIQRARKLADEWRACHAYSLNTFNVTLRNRIKKFTSEPIVAQRLKRMSTIVDKLNRYPAMQLTTMQDIGGIRAILETIDDVYELAKEYQDPGRFAHELYNEKDYIKSPRDEDGYRSLHLIYRYKNNRAPQYNGLLVEMQIRTKLQHVWATAVETMGTFLGQALKSRQGDRDWIEFFAITSSAFAHIENSNLVPRFSKLNKSETFIEVMRAEKKIDALSRMQGLSLAADMISKNLRTGRPGWYYHLIILNSLKKKVRVKPYSRDDFERAVKDYARVESNASQEKIEPVLVSAGKIKDLRRAYPNFFLDIRDFAEKVRNIVNLAGSPKKK
jgi:hypothetical protein